VKLTFLLKRIFTKLNFNAPFLYTFFLKTWRVIFLTFTLFLMRGENLSNNYIPNTKYIPNIYRTYGSETLKYPFFRHSARISTAKELVNIYRSQMRYSDLGNWRKLRKKKIIKLHTPIKCWKKHCLFYFISVTWPIKT